MELSPLVSSEDHSNNIGFVQGQAVALFNGDSFAVSIEDGDTVNLLTHDGRKFKHAIDMLVQAFNNRTRQRNYFRLYCDLLDGQLSDEDFDKEIDEHPDDYVVGNENKPTKEDLEMAIILAHRMKDIDDMTDLSMAFSFDMEEADKLAIQIESSHE